jgi:hypothetical protein
VDPLQHEHVAGAELDARPAVRVRAPGEEVVARGLDLLAPEQPPHVILEQGQVDGFQGLEVPLALLVPGRQVTIDVVAVEADADGVHPVDLELDGEPLDEGGLARGGGAGDGDDPDPVARRRHAIGHHADLLLVEPLRHADEL